MCRIISCVWDWDLCGIGICVGFVCGIVCGIISCVGYTDSVCRKI